MKKFATVTLLLMLSLAAYAQGTDEDLRRQVDISKEFAPTVGRAEKLPVNPAIGDTVRLRPDFDYAVRPHPWNVGFDIDPINAVRVEAHRYIPQSPFYVKIGGGYPGHSLLDFAFNDTAKGANSYGVSLNHYGRYYSIKNDFGIKVKAPMTLNDAAVYGKIAVGRRTTLEGKLSYGYNSYSLYGFVSEDNNNKTPYQRYMAPEAGVVFGHTFTDLSYFNFRVGGNIYGYDGKSAAENEGGDPAEEYTSKKKSWGAAAFLQAGKRFSVHEITLRADVDTWRMSEDTRGEETGGNGFLSPGNRETIYDISAGYRLHDDSFVFTLGAGAAYQTSKYDDAKVWFLPRVSVAVPVAGDKFVPYAVLDSRLTANSYRNLTRLYPYLAPNANRGESDPAQTTGFAGQPTTRYDLKAGFRGAIGGVFSYNIYAGGRISKNVPLLLTREPLPPVPSQSSWLSHILLTEKQINSFTVGVDFAVRTGSGFTVSVSGNYNDYSGKTYDRAVNLPSLNAGLELEYRNASFAASVGADIVGERYFAVMDYAIAGEGAIEFEKQETVLDLKLSLEYFPAAKWSVFLEAHNLANQKLYPYPDYAGNGADVTAGVKIRF